MAGINTTICLARMSSGREMDTEPTAVMQHVRSLRWPIARSVGAAVLVLAAAMIFVLTSNPPAEQDVPAVPLPAVTSPLAPTTPIAPTHHRPRD